MRRKTLLLSAIGGLAEEGPMEGVVVTAWKEGSTISVSVVTDSTGCYTFPESKLDGDFAVKILAVGDEFVGPRAVDVRPGVTAGADTDSSASPEADRRVRGDPLTGTVRSGDQDV